MELTDANTGDKIHIVHNSIMYCRLITPKYNVTDICSFS